MLFLSKLAIVAVLSAALVLTAVVCGPVALLTKFVTFLNTK